MPREEAISVKIPRETYERLREYKEKTGVTITFAVEKAVAEYFERREQTKRAD